MCVCVQASARACVCAIEARLDGRGLRAYARVRACASKRAYGRACVLLRVRVSVRPCSSVLRVRALSRHTPTAHAVAWAGLSVRAGRELRAYERVRARASEQAGVRACD